MQKYQLLGQLFKAMSHPTRLMILNRLRDHSPLCVCEILEETELEQSNLSQHLKILRESGLVSSERVGVNVHYQIVDPTVYELLDTAGQLLSNQLRLLTEQLKD